MAKKTRVETLVTYDGKPQPTTGSGIWDSTATKRIDRYVTESDLLRNGKTVGRVRREVFPGRQDYESVLYDQQARWHEREHRLGLRAAIED